MRVNFKRMKKQLGQNFIFDTNLLAAIASDAQIDGKSVVEIGMGAGTLTEQLAMRAAKVVGFEIDLDLKPVLEQRLARFPNVSARFCDFMKCDMKELEEELGGGYKVVANLPYYITTPIVCRFLDEAKKVGAMLVMVQEEVAERFCAQPDTKEYGAITVALKTAAEGKIVRRVGRFLRERGVRVRLNTNGHGNAINGRDITAELKEAADIVSVSLNESNSRDYQRICQCDLGEKGFDEMLDFAAKCKAQNIEVVFSVVDTIGAASVEKCRRIAESLRIPLRVRKYIPEP